MTNIRKLVPLSLFTHPASQPSYATSREQNMILSHLNTQSFIYSPGGGLGRGGVQVRLTLTHHDFSRKRSLLFWKDVVQSQAIFVL